MCFAGDASFSGYYVMMLSETVDVETVDEVKVVLAPVEQLPYVASNTSAYVWPVPRHVCTCVVVSMCMVCAVLSRSVSHVGLVRYCRV